MLMLSTLKHFRYDESKIALKVMHGINFFTSGKLFLPGRKHT